MTEYRIIDAHCHIYPDRIAGKAVEAVERFYDGLTGKPGKGTAEDLLSAGAEAGIDHYIIFSVATSAHQVDSINRFIAEKAQASNGKMTGLGTMHEDVEDMEAVIGSIRALGLKGVKLHPDIQRFEADAPWAMDMYAACEGVLPVCLHTGDKRYDYSNPDRIARIAAAFPRLTLIAAHFGGWSVWEEAARVLSRYDNILVDCSSSLYALTPQTARTLVRLYGSERVLFGTDYPLWPARREVERVMEMGLTETELHNILHKNAERLYGL